MGGQKRAAEAEARGVVPLTGQVELSMPSGFRGQTMPSLQEGAAAAGAVSGGPDGCLLQSLTRLTCRVVSKTLAWLLPHATQQVLALLGP